MNINDVESQGRPENPLADIFERQTELMQKYHKIEESNGLLITDQVPVNLHSSKGQQRLKDFAWRITEELGEALEARIIHEDMPAHFDEEVADALHFLVEFTILAGVGSGELVDWITGEEAINVTDDWATLFVCSKVTPMHTDVYAFRDPLRQYGNLAVAVGSFIESLAKTCNCLKNKPWKQTQMKTDVDYFYSKLAATWISFIQICITAGITEDDLYNLYFRKNAVNQFRQRSKY